MPFLEVGRRYRYAVAIFICAVCSFCALLKLHAYKSSFLDLKAFYCAGQAVIHGADPYREASLRHCEMALGTFLLPTIGHFDQPTVPVPWAPYTIPLLAMLAFGSFGTVAWIWTAINFACLSVSADILRRAMPELSPVAIAVFVLFAGVPTEAILGQPVGVILLAVVLAGVFTRIRSVAGMTCTLLIIAIWPYVALPCGLAFAAAGTAGRRAVALAGFLVLIYSFGFQRTISFEYLTMVVPDHSRAAVLEVTQQSLTSLIGISGIMPGLATVVGLVIYAASLALGLWAGRRFAYISGRPEALPWVAIALAVFAAPFLHYQELACALPGVAVVLAVAPRNGLALSAAIGLFVPWIGLVLQISYGYMVAPFAGLAAWNGRKTHRFLRVVVSAVFLLIVALTVSAFCRKYLVNPTSYYSTPVGPNALAEKSWLGYVSLDWQSLGKASLAARAFSSVCCFIFLAVAVQEAARQRSQRIS